LECFKRRGKRKFFALLSRFCGGVAIAHGCPEANPGKNAIISGQWGEIRLVNRPAKKGGRNLSARKRSGRSGNIRKSPNAIERRYFTGI